MGGNSGGGFGSSDLKRLEERAKKELKGGSTDASRHIFISFAYEDVDEVNLLRGQAQNDKSELEFDDYSVKEAFDSANADYIKRQIRARIDRCSVTLVYLSENSSRSRWVNWEIEESLKRSKSVIGIYTGDNIPAALPHSFVQHGCKAVKWDQQAIMRAIERANTDKK